MKKLILSAILLTGIFTLHAQVVVVRRPVAAVIRPVVVERPVVAPAVIVRPVVVAPAAVIVRPAILPRRRIVVARS